MSFHKTENFHPKSMPYFGEEMREARRVVEQGHVPRERFKPERSEEIMNSSPESWSPTTIPKKMHIRLVAHKKGNEGPKPPFAAGESL